MKRLVLVVAVVIACPAAFAEDEKPKKDDQNKKDLKALQGTWKLVKQVRNGKETDKDQIAGFTVTVKGDKWEAAKDDVVFLSGTGKLDPSKDPKAADWTITTENELKGKVALAIYKVDKDSFHNCYSLDERPKKFESKEDSQVTYDVYERVKEKKKEK
jgi:uncharacterized protein (TIGR03067 family)